MSLILHNPQVALAVLQALGFFPSSNNRRLVYNKYYIKLLGFVKTPLLIKVYCLTNISATLFNLAVTQLMVKIVGVFDHYNFNFNDSCQCDHDGSHSRDGVFMYDETNHVTETKNMRPLISELLQLPNQYHCFRGQFCFGQKMIAIWILNNNGHKYDNIDWQNMDLNKLISNFMVMDPSVMKQQIIINCVSYCLKRNELTFLKKIFYFLTNVYQKYRFSSWPLYPDEHIMMQILKYNPNIACNLYFMKKVQDIMSQVARQCKREVRPHDMQHLFASKVDALVKDEIIPKFKSILCKKTAEKNIQLLKEKKFWECFICKNKHGIDCLECPQCKQHKTILSINPYDAFIYLDSSLFNIKKPFGILSHKRVIDTFSHFEYQNNDNTIIMITCQYEQLIKFSIVFDEKDSLTVSELKVIIYTFFASWIHLSVIAKRSQFLDLSFESQPIFSKMEDNEIIPPSNDMKPYFIDLFENKIFQRIEPKYKIRYGKKHCNCQCPFMIATKNKNKNIDVDPFKDCPYFSNKFDNNSDDVLQHLSSFDHFASFGIDQTACNDKCNCLHLIRFASYMKNHHCNYNYYNSKKNTQEEIFQDEKHLYLYYHPCSNTRRKNCMMNGGTKYTWYDYISNKQQADLYIRNRSQFFDTHVNQEETMAVPQLLVEVIRNGYIDDLLPNREENSMYGEKKYMLNKLESMMKQYQTVIDSHEHDHEKEKNLQLAMLSFLFGGFCENAFKIFKQVDKKMNHLRLKKIGSPLHGSEVLALILYCNGECNYDLCLTQRSGDDKIQKKWPLFDCLVNRSIVILSEFEEHWENIYSGISGVFYKFNQIRDIVYLTTNVSFTTDLKVAKQFRGSSGMIIGLNMKRSYAVATNSFHACDVSWVSGQPWEKEILCTRGSEIRFYSYKMKEIQTQGNEKQQWFVCDEGNLQETSFQAMFGQF